LICRFERLHLQAELVVADDGDDVAGLDRGALLDRAAQQCAANARARRRHVAALHLSENGFEIRHLDRMKNDLAGARGASEAQDNRRDAKHRKKHGAPCRRESESGPSAPFDLYIRNFANKQARHSEDSR
jgi:hypothetical protein